MNIFLACGLIFLFALGFSRLLNRVKLPAVTSYLLLGILMGPYLLRIIPPNLVKATDSVGYFVLGLVAFSLGENFLWSQFKRVGKEVIIISIGEVVGAFIVVALGLKLFGVPSYEALILAALAPASSPTSIYMVIRELKAKGKFTETLIDVLAIDDAWGIILFCLTIPVAKILYAGGIAKVHFGPAIFLASKEILGAITLGIILALIFSFLSRYVKSRMNILILGLGFILVTIGISLHFGFSPLLAGMFMGTTLMNFTKKHIYFDVLKKVDWPFYLLFFVLCGSSLNIPLLKTLGLIGILYTIFRAVGLYFGATIAAQMSHCDSRIKKYMGLGLFAQAGVTLGLAIVARSQFPEIGNEIFTIIIGTTIIFEIIGPLTCKFALIKVGEAAK